MKKRADGRWVKKITLPNGKTKYFYSSAKTQRDATKDFNKQIIEFEEKDKKGKTFSEIANEWEEIKYTSVEHQTMVRYKTFVRHLKGFFENEYIKSITFEDIQLFLQDLTLKGYSNKTIKDQTAILKMIFSYAYIKKYINQDPSYYIKAPKGRPASEREALTAEQTEIVNNSIQCTFGLFPYFLLYTGLRKGEALALQYKDIDFENNTITVSKSVYYDNNTPHIKQPKTVSGIRQVILLDCVKDKLKRNANKDELIFTFDGQLIKNSMFTRKWNKYLSESGLKNITPHQFRHTFATFLFEAGMQPKDTQSIMGHKDISTTQRIYTHIRQKRAEENLIKLNNFFSEKMQ